MWSNIPSSKPKASHSRKVSLAPPTQDAAPERAHSFAGGDPAAPSSRPSTSSNAAKPRFNRAETNFDNPFARLNEQARRRASSVGIDADDALSPDAADRVFPIRSVVSVDPTPTTATEFSDREGYFPAQRVPSGRGATLHQHNATDTKHDQILENTAEDTDPDDQTKDSDVDAYRSLPESRKTSDGSQAIPYQPGYQIHTDGDSQRSASVASTTRSRMPYDSRKSGMASSIMSGSRNVADLDDPGGILTARFKHVVTEDGHAVITGRDGETLQRCEDEPIHIPGAIQTFGALVALQEEGEGKLVVRIASENSSRVLGYSPKELFACESFTDILSDEQSDNLLDHIDFIKDEDAGVEANGPEVFTMSIRSKQRKAHKLWCAIHMHDKNPGIIICEFELEDDAQYPLAPKNDETPEPPEDTLNSEPSAAELKESTETKSRPLRVLRSARKRKGEAAAMEVFNIMSQVQEQLSEAPSLDLFLKVLVGVVKELTGFHRVMVYQFDMAFNGKVVTELVDPRATKDLYKGLHFPASDIPKQARDLYRINKVRLLYDRDHETARLVCRTMEDLDTPLDLTHSYLRAMSPIHIKYLANMAVRSSMSISINAFNELWGLISCHTYGSKGTRVSFPIRKMCRLVGDSASRNIERLSYASRLQARKLINTSPSSRNPSGYIIASSEDLLNLFDADFGLVSIHDETKILGKLEATQEALAMLEYLRLRKLNSVTMSQDIRFDFPDMRYSPGFKVIAGLLLVPLSAAGEDFIVFFRKGQMKEVKWAGNPYEKFVKEGTEGYLEPRKSFKTWSETVVGKSREWTEEEIETAAVLCLVYGKFIEVWRQKEAALQNSQLTKLLLANSAHEVRTPLNAIINYLEIALEGSLDSETRENLSKSHSASKSLIYVINDLLDLTKTEQNSDLISGEVFELRTTFREAVDMFRGDAERKKISFEVIEHPDIPEKVIGDHRRVRQAISNITANAIQATQTGGVKVEILLVGKEAHHADVEVIVQDTGVGMDAAKLDTLFAELEQAESEDKQLIEDALGPGGRAITEGEKAPNRTTLGLGLAVVARIVRNMNGQLRLKSEPGKGSRFAIQFPFDLPPQDDESAESENTLVESEALVPSQISLPPQGDEMMLVDNSALSRRGSSENSPPTLTRNNSDGSQTSLLSKKSLHSFKSGRSRSSVQSGKSDVDRLIEAMQEPHMVESRPASSRTHSSSKVTRRDNSGSSLGSQAGPAMHRDRSSSIETGLGPRPAEYLRTEPPSSPGTKTIASSRFALRAIRVPDEANFPRHVEFASQETHALKSPSEKSEAGMNPLDRLNVLIAEDDPINSRIIQKRLQKVGHLPFLTVNGEECASKYGEMPRAFDIILMDMQMPIVDGLTSTKMIRSFEKADSSFELSPCAALNGRVPIIAVSASLVEKDRQKYIDAGFDGWILKPISFQRLAELMSGIVDLEAKTKSFYKPGQWELGGWFHRDSSDVPKSDTTPEDSKPASTQSPATVDAMMSGPDDEVEGRDADRESLSSSTSALTAIKQESPGSAQAVEDAAVEVTPEKASDVPELTKSPEPI